MVQYNRILVKYRLSTDSTAWSDFHWCDIKRDNASSPILVTIAPAVLDGSMPYDTKFMPLSVEEAKKLLVLDCTCEGPTARYCLVIETDKMYKVDFRYDAFVPRARVWLDQDSFDNQGISIKDLFQGTNDPRLTMFNANKEQNSGQLPDVIPPNFKQQYRHWCEQRAIWLGLKNAPVIVEMTAVQSTLQNQERERVHEKICAELEILKSATQNQREYESVLYALLNKTADLSDFSDAYPYELPTKIKKFRDILLSNSDDLRVIFAQSENQPYLAEVCNYTLAVVAVELRIWIPDLGDNLSIHDFNVSWPNSYYIMQLGKARNEALLGESSATFGSHELAYALQEEYDRRSQNRNNFFPSPQSQRSTASSQADPNLRYRVLCLIAGAGLCTLGAYLAMTSSFFVGVTLILAGYFCVVCSSVITTSNGNEDVPIPESSLWGYPVRSGVR